MSEQLSFQEQFTRTDCPDWSRFPCQNIQRALQEQVGLATETKKTDQNKKTLLQYLSCGTRVPAPMGRRKCLPQNKSCKSGFTFENKFATCKEQFALQEKIALQSLAGAGCLAEAGCPTGAGCLTGAGLLQEQVFFKDQIAHRNKFVDGRGPSQKTELLNDRHRATPNVTTEHCATSNVILTFAQRTTTQRVKNH